MKTWKEGDKFKVLRKFLDANSHDVVFTVIGVTDDYVPRLNGEIENTGYRIWVNADCVERVTPNT